MAFEIIRAKGVAGKCESCRANARQLIRIGPFVSSPTVPTRVLLVCTGCVERLTDALNVFRASNIAEKATGVIQ